MTIDTEPNFLAREDGTRIAYHHTPGGAPGVIFCGGFMSDMTGTKALALEEACQKSSRSYTRFDYRGHGQSGAAFESGTIGLWAGDAQAVLDKVTQGPQIIVGSSMGGWIMLLLARARPARIAGLIGIAPAPDFVLRMWDQFSDEIKATLKRDGVYYAPSEYSEEPYAITLQLIEDGRQHLVLQEPLSVDYPVRILHGMVDPDVPWRQSLTIVERLQGDDIVVTFSKNGDHRLSKPDDIARLIGAVETLARI
jgi:pimeloyl-ACP methyl ester carboxylesterase